MALLRSVALALGAHAAMAAAMAGVGAASVRLATWTLLLLPLAAVVGAVLAQRIADPSPTAVRAGGAWFATGLAHHYLVGMTPLWADRPLSGSGHLAWDVAFHLPPIALAALAVRRAPPSC